MASPESQQIVLMQPLAACRYENAVDRNEARRIERMAMQVMGESAPAWAQQYAQHAASAVKIADKILDEVVPLASRVGLAAFAIYDRLPQEHVKGLGGLGLCFFGGRYAVSIAAIEAFRSTGGSKAYIHLQELQSQFQALQDAEAGEETVYLPKVVKGASVLIEERNGKWRLTDKNLKSKSGGLSYRKTKNIDDVVRHIAGPDWESLVSGSDEGDGWVRCKVERDAPPAGEDQHIASKIALVLRTVDPEVVQTAVSGLWTAYMGVMTVVKFQFAQTLALAQGVGESLRPSIAKIAGPTLVSVTPPEYQKWISPAVNIACKGIAGLIAWKLQYLLSMCNSSLQGGMMSSAAALQIMYQLRPSDSKLTSAQESLFVDAAGWTLAACGMYSQLFHKQPVPFLISPLLWPLDFVEWILKFSAMM